MAERTTTSARRAMLAGVLLAVVTLAAAFLPSTRSTQQRLVVVTPRAVTAVAVEHHALDVGLTDHGLARATFTRAFAQSQRLRFLRAAAKPIVKQRKIPAGNRSAQALPPAARISIGTAVSVSLPSGSCWSLLAKYFGDVLEWAKRIVQRESHCTSVANWHEGCDSSGRTNSHAMGPWQICWPQHEVLAGPAGCSDPMNIECNMKMARILYNEEGRAPWGG